MRLTAMVPGSLVPSELAAELAGALQAPTLSRLLARATVAAESTSDPGEAEAGWIAREVFGVPHFAPTAPYAWAVLTGGVESRFQIWHADPIHLEIGRESLIVQGLAAAPDETEADPLIAVANETLAPVGAALHRVGASWFLHSECDWSMSPRPLAAVMGRPLPIPGDETDMLAWSRLHNEIQMRWHVDPVNIAREERGAPVINAIWLHGGGRWSPRSALRWKSVHSERPELRGAALAAGAAIAGNNAPIRQDALMIWDDAASIEAGDWPHWLEAMRNIDRKLAALPPSERLELVLAGPRRTRTWVARPSDRYRVWRRTQLAETLTE